MMEVLFKVHDSRKLLLVTPDDLVYVIESEMGILRIHGVLTYFPALEDNV